jgi:hypothetical protein
MGSRVRGGVGKWNASTLGAWRAFWAIGVSMNGQAQLNRRNTLVLFDAHDSHARGKMERSSSDSTLSDRRKRARKIIINPYADFAFTAIFFVEARRTECHGAASAMMP